MNYELLKATCVYGLGAMLKSCQLFQLVCVHYRKGECSSRKCICWGCCLDGSGRHLLKPQVLRLGQQSATAAWQGPEWRAVVRSGGGGILKAAQLAVRTRLLTPPPAPSSPSTPSTPSTPPSIPSGHVLSCQRASRGLCWRARGQHGDPGPGE